MDEIDQKIDNGLAAAQALMLGITVQGLLEMDDEEILREACETARTDPKLIEGFSAEGADLVANIACAKLHGKDPMQFLR